MINWPLQWPGYEPSSPPWRPYRPQKLSPVGHLCADFVYVAARPAAMEHNTIYARAYDIVAVRSNDSRQHRGRNVKTTVRSACACAHPADLSSPTSQHPRTGERIILLLLLKNTVEDASRVDDCVVGNYGGSGGGRWERRDPAQRLLRRHIRRCRRRRYNISITGIQSSRRRMILYCNPLNIILYLCARKKLAAHRNDRPNYM